MPRSGASNIVALGKGHIDEDRETVIGGTITIFVMGVLLGGVGLYANAQLRYLKHQLTYGDSLLGEPPEIRTPQ
jgi:hypothetical protein